MDRKKDYLSRYYPESRFGGFTDIDQDQHGFDHCVYGYEAEPYHLGFSRLAYFCGVLHQRLAPGLCKTTLFAFARKP
jgi:hypothetical protein